MGNSQQAHCFAPRKYHLKQKSKQVNRKNKAEDFETEETLYGNNKILDTPLKNSITQSSSVNQLNSQKEQDSITIEIKISLKPSSSIEAQGSPRQKPKIVDRFDITSSPLLSTSNQSVQWKTNLHQNSPIVYSRELFQKSSSMANAIPHQQRSGLNEIQHSEHPHHKKMDQAENDYLQKQNAQGQKQIKNKVYYSQNKALNNCSTGHRFNHKTGEQEGHGRDRQNGQISRPLLKIREQRESINIEDLELPEETSYRESQPRLTFS